MVNKIFYFCVMGTIITISFASILMLSLVAEFKKDERLFHFRDFTLIILSIGVFLGPGTGSNNLLFWVTTSFLSVLFGISLFNGFKGFLKHLLPIVLLPVFVIVDQPLVYGEYSVSFATFSALFFVAFGYSIPKLVDLKSYAVSRILSVERSQVSLAVGPVILGVALFVATFFHSTAGIFLVTVGLWSGVMIHKGQGKNLALFSLGILLVYPFISLAKLDAVDITLGKTKEGLLFGAFSVLLVMNMSTRSSRPIFSGVISTALVMLLFAFILILGTQKSDFGGIDAFVAGIYGMSLMFLATSETEWKSTVFISVILSGLVVAPLTIDSSVQLIDIITEQNNLASESDLIKKLDPFDQKGLDLNTISGKYEIAENDLNFTFELGPKGGRTKGKFKALNGSVNILDPIEKSEFDVQLNVADLTTMNKFRDESLMGEEYFNVAKFPGINFKSKKLTSKGDAYELIGDFIMMGVKNPQVVVVKLISGSEKGSNPVLIGKGSIDRTLFGMKPDPKEGNVVDFQFSIQLVKVN